MLSGALLTALPTPGRHRLYLEREPVTSGRTTVSSELDAGPKQRGRSPGPLCSVSVFSWFLGIYWKEGSSPQSLYPQISLKDSSVAVNTCFILFFAKDRNSQCSEPKADKSLHTFHFSIVETTLCQPRFPH